MNQTKKRAPNFTQSEKSALLAIIAGFKDVIESKKTDALTWKQKDEAWEIVAKKFNSNPPNMIYRTKDSLRKFYDNIKKDIRKEVADEKRYLSGTGGGPPKQTVNPEKDLILSIVNTKTIHGLTNPFDSDASASTELESSAVGTDHTYTPLQITSEPGPEVGSIQTEDVENVPVHDWGKIASSQLKTPISKEIKQTWTKRRRPQIAVPSSQLAGEYAELAKLKKEVFEAEKERIIEQRKYEEELFNLKKQKLSLEIQIKKVELQNLNH